MTSTRTLLVLALFSFSGCSGIQTLREKYNPFRKTPPRTAKTYSEDIERDFEAIERARALEDYRQTRWQRWESYIRSERKKAPKKSLRKTRRKKMRPKSKRVGKRKKERVSKEVSKEVSKTRIEIDQQMTWFCMKNRKHPRFRKLSRCNNHTQKILNRCTRSHGHKIGRKVLSCVKKRLR